MEAARKYLTWRTWLAASMLIAMVALSQLTAWHPLLRSNQSVLQHLTLARKDAFTSSLSALTSLFNPFNATILVAVCGLGVWALTRNPRQAFYVWSTSLLAVAISSATKALANISRPPLSGHLVRVASASYPSGHTTAVTALAVSLALVFSLYIRTTKRGRPAIIIIWLAVAAWIALVALSRLYLGVHWLTDVIGGILAGAGSALLLADLVQIDSRLLPRFRVLHQSNQQRR